MTCFVVCVVYYKYYFKKLKIDKYSYKKTFNLRTYKIYLIIKNLKNKIYIKIIYKIKQNCIYLDPKNHN